jgi:hypothetical protein
MMVYINDDIHIHDDDQGAVLLIVLCVVLVTMIMGIVLMKSTNIESKIAGNDLANQRDFYMCEAAGEVAKVKFDDVVSTMVMDEITNTTVDISSTVNGTGPVQNAKVTISYLRSTNPPVGSGTSPASAFANYYVIETTVNGRKIQKGVWKAFPKSD